MTAAAALTHVG